MILSTPSNMRKLDALAIKDYGIPGLILMENAATGVADYILSQYAGARARAPWVLGAQHGAIVAEKPPEEAAAQAKRINVLVVCGRGNNGGDGFAVARKLFLAGQGVQVAVLANEDDLEGDALANRDIVERLGIDLVYAAEDNIADLMAFCCARADVIVDAIFGTGFRGKAEGVFEAAIEAINESGRTVVSIDAPSGLDGLRGAAAGPCVRADATLALGLLKTGLVSGPDVGYAGRVALLDIGIPREAVDKLEWRYRLTTAERVGGSLRPRARDTHKGDYGKLMLVTGSPGMTGAGCLAATAALRAGAGLVYLAAPASLSQIYETSVREAITVSGGANTDRYLTVENANNIIEFSAKGLSALAIGPGLSMEQDVAMAVKKIVSGVSVPLVIDADGLNAVATDVSVLSRLKADAVLTPHAGEMARLLDTSVENVAKNRIEVAGKFAARWGVTVVLKGFRTVVALADGSIFINPTGNPGMATAGAGDSLTGVIAALLGGGMPAQDAAVAGAYIHGLAGDLAAAALGEASVTAGDIVAYLPAAFQALAPYTAASAND